MQHPNYQPYSPGQGGYHPTQPPRHPPMAAASQQHHPSHNSLLPYSPPPHGIIQTITTTTKTTTTQTTTYHPNYYCHPNHYNSYQQEERREFRREPPPPPQQCHEEHQFPRHNTDQNSYQQEGPPAFRREPPPPPPPQYHYDQQEHHRQHDMKRSGYQPPPQNYHDQHGHHQQYDRLASGFWPPPPHSYDQQGHQQQRDRLRPGYQPPPQHYHHDQHRYPPQYHHHDRPPAQQESPITKMPYSRHDQGAPTPNVRPFQRFMEDKSKCKNGCGETRMARRKICVSCNQERLREVVQRRRGEKKRAREEVQQLTPPQHCHHDQHHYPPQCHHHDRPPPQQEPPITKLPYSYLMEEKKPALKCSNGCEETRMAKRTICTTCYNKRKREDNQKRRLESKRLREEVQQLTPPQHYHHDQHRYPPQYHHHDRPPQQQEPLITKLPYSRLLALQEEKPALKCKNGCEETRMAGRTICASCNRKRTREDIQRRREEKKRVREEVQQLTQYEKVVEENQPFREVLDADSSAIGKAQSSSESASAGTALAAAATAPIPNIVTTANSCSAVNKQESSEGSGTTTAIPVPPSTAQPATADMHSTVAAAPPPVPPTEGKNPTKPKRKSKRVCGLDLDESKRICGLDLDESDADQTDSKDKSRCRLDIENLCNASSLDAIIKEEFYDWLKNPIKGSSTKHFTKFKKREGFEENGYCSATIREEKLEAFLNHITVTEGYKANEDAEEDCGVAFMNRDEATCEPHMDTWKGYLYVMKGSKIVWMRKNAYQLDRKVIKDNGKGGQGEKWNEFKMNPFVCQKGETDKKREERLKNDGWEKKDLKEGYGLFIDHGWPHCIRSEEGTIAISLKIVPDN